MGLESVYAEGYRRAKALGNEAAQISYLSNLGTARMLLLHYAPALEAYLEASALAERTGDWSALGGIAVNLSRVYQRMGDANAALSALERGKAATGSTCGSPAGLIRRSYSCVFGAFAPRCKKTRPSVVI